VRPSVESSIDELYKGPIDRFVPGRLALARTLKGDEARQVKALQKPRVGAWAVNQLYWHARPVYDRVVKSGEKLRAAQIAALGGRRADVRAATEAHHRAISDAVTAASRMAAEAGVHPGAEELIRTFEALSLARELLERAGRLTRPLQPAGFEALAGIAIKARASGGAGTSKAPPAPVDAPGAPPATFSLASASKLRQVEARRNAAMVAAARQRQLAEKKAEAAVERAEAAEARARQQWESAKEALERAVRALEDLSGKLTR
jgi:hypothetical protein